MRRKELLRKLKQAVRFLETSEYFDKEMGKVLDHETSDYLSKKGDAAYEEFRDLLRDCVEHI